jgi:hypothetical protein
MTRNRIAGAIAALAMLAAPAIASAHRGHDDSGRHHGRHHHAKKAHVKDLPAGTVTSFTAGELTITLTSGKAYSATVTGKTVIKCRTAAPQPPATARSARHGADDPAADDRRDDQDKNHGDDSKGDDNGNGRCTTADLVAGTKVIDADLRLSNGGMWKKVVLLK